jgi:hypothetical protein
MRTKAIAEGVYSPASAAEMKRATIKGIVRDSVGSKKGKSKGPIPGKLKRYDGRAIMGRARNDKGLRALWDELDLPRFKEALEFAEDPRHKMLLFALTTPKMRKMSFPELCRRCQLSLRDVSAFWRNHQLQKGMMRMMNHMPQVMEDTAEDAKTRVVPCETCDGTGKLTREIFNRQVGSICGECHGDGTVRIVGDKDARNLVFESAGLRKSGLSVMQSVTVNAPPSLEDSIKGLEAAFDISVEPSGSDTPSEGENNA